MTKLIITIIASFFVKQILAQSVVIGIERNNILFAGVENRIQIMAENTPCSSLIVKTSNGKISGSSCEYTYTVNYDLVRDSNITSTKIEVYKKVKKFIELVSKRIYSIRKIPDPKVCVMKCDSLKIRKVFFQKINFSDGHPRPPDIRAQSNLFDFGIPSNSQFIIDSFYCSIFRGDSCIIKPILNNGNYFMDALYEEFKKIKEGDTIVFDKIYAKGNDGSKRILKSVTILVTK